MSALYFICDFLSYLYMLVDVCLIHSRWHHLNNQTEIFVLFFSFFLNMFLVFSPLWRKTLYLMLPLFYCNSCQKRQLGKHFIPMHFIPWGTLSGQVEKFYSGTCIHSDLASVAYMCQKAETIKHPARVELTIQS